MLKLNNPFLVIFGGLGVARGYGRSIVEYGKLLWLQWRTKKWYESFPGIEAILTEEGRQWLIKGLDLAKEYALLTPETEMDDEVVARVRHVVVTPAGWDAIKTIIRLALEAPDVANALENEDDNSFVNQLSTEGANMVSITTVVSGDDVHEDPITILYIIWISLQITCLIRRRREKTKTGQRRIDNFYRRTERRFFNQVIVLGKQS